MRAARLTKRPLRRAKGAADVSSSSAVRLAVASTWRGPTCSCTRSSAGSSLLGEVQRHARHRPVVVLGDALLELGAKLRVAGQQTGEGRSVRRSSRRGATASTVVERAPRAWKSDSSPKKSPRRR